MRPSRAAIALLTIGPLLAACGTSKPAALPDDPAFRACLHQAGVNTDGLDAFTTRRATFERPAPWSCVLDLGGTADRHAVLKDVFPSNSRALLAAMTAWIDTQQTAPKAIADDVGTLVAAADDAMPTDPAEASARHDLDDMFQALLSMAIYQHADGALPGYAAYLARPDLKGDSSAPNRYYQDLMDKGGPVADRLRSYAAIIDGLRDRLRTD